MTGMTPENKFGGSFGANEWLVDEMYEQYLRDPNSITEDWKAFFAGYKPASNGTSATNGVATAPGTPPVPKRDLKQQASPTVPSAPIASAPATPSAPVPVAPVAPSAPVAAAPQLPKQPAQPQPVVQQVVQQVVRPAQQPTPTPAQPISKPVQEITSPSAARIEPLRGVANRVVQSMEAS